MSDDDSRSLKLVIVGAMNVGKTCVTKYFTKHSFTPNKHTTLGADLWRKSLTVQGCTVELIIWDTAGQESFRSIVPYYYRKASLAIVMFAVDSLESFEDVDWWIKTLQTECKDAYLMLIGNKTDLETRCVSTENGQKKAEEYKIGYTETSAKNGEGVDGAFRTMVERYLEANTQWAEEITARNQVEFGTEQTYSGYCC
jgi:small GTP-binding protein